MANEKESQRWSIPRAVIEGLFVTALTAVVVVVLNVDKNVGVLLELQRQQERVDDRDPVVRYSLFQNEKQRTNERLEALNVRLERLENVRSR